MSRPQNHYDFSKKPGMFDPEEADVWKGCLVYVVAIAIGAAFWFMVAVIAFG